MVSAKPGSCRPPAQTPARMWREGGGREGGGRPLVFQTPESQFPVLPSTRRERGEVGGGRGEGRREDSGWRAEIPLVADVGWNRQKIISQEPSVRY